MECNYHHGITFQYNIIITIIMLTDKIYLNNTPVIIYVESSHDSAAPIQWLLIKFNNLMLGNNLPARTLFWFIFFPCMLSQIQLQHTHLHSLYRLHNNIIILPLHCILHQVANRVSSSGSASPPPKGERGWDIEKNVKRGGGERGACFFILQYKWSV